MDKFWLSLWATMMLCITIIIVVLTVCVHRQDMAIIKAADPLASACAVSGGTYVKMNCAILLARK
jgi:hypothetical protein